MQSQHKALTVRSEVGQGQMLHSSSALKSKWKNKIDKELWVFNILSLFLLNITGRKLC